MVRLGLEPGAAGPAAPPESAKLPDSRLAGRWTIVTVALGAGALAALGERCGAKSLNGEGRGDGALPLLLDTIERWITERR